MQIQAKLVSSAYEISVSSYQFNSAISVCQRIFQAHASITQLLMLHETR